MIEYRSVQEHLRSPDLGNYCAYGIYAYQVEPFSSKNILAIHDTMYFSTPPMPSPLFIAATNWS